MFLAKFAPVESNCPFQMRNRFAKQTEILICAADGQAQRCFNIGLPPEAFADAQRLTAGIKALPLLLTAPRPVAEAISSAGGIAWSSLNAAFMLNRMPGVFCTGEMLDWEAPTGGYLLTACLASGRRAGLGALAMLRASAS